MLQQQKPLAAAAPEFAVGSSHCSLLPTFQEDFAVLWLGQAALKSGTGGLPPCLLAEQLVFSELGGELDPKLKSC